MNSDDQSDFSNKYRKPSRRFVLRLAAAPVFSKVVNVTPYIPPMFGFSPSPIPAASITGGEVIKRMLGLFSINYKLHYRIAGELHGFTGIYRHFWGAGQRSSEQRLDTSSITRHLSDKAGFYDWLNKSTNYFMAQTAQLARAAAEFRSAIADPQNPLSSFWKEFNAANNAYTLEKIRNRIHCLHNAAHGANESDLVQFVNKMSRIGMSDGRRQNALARIRSQIDQFQNCTEGENNLERLEQVLATMDRSDSRLFGDTLQLSPAVEKRRHLFWDGNFCKITNDICGRFGIETGDFLGLLAEDRLYLPWKNANGKMSAKLDWTKPQSIDTILEASHETLKSIPRFVSERKRAIHDPANCNAPILQEIQAELPDYVERLIPELMQRHFPAVNINRLDQHYQTERRREEAKWEQERIEQKKRIAVRDPWQEKESNWTGKHKGRLPPRSSLCL